MRFSLVVLWCVLVITPCLNAEERSPEALDQTKLKTLNDHFPFHVPDTVAAWQTRADELRRRVQVATGLWPMPPRPNVQPVIHGKIEREGFTAEKLYFESLPGHYVTGMLFRPAGEGDGETKKYPGVLSPHGHGGRLMRLDDGELKTQLDSGGEIHERSGRYPKIARCAHLARMGCVVLIFDMLGYGDSQQIEFETAHRHKDTRPEEANHDSPCFYSVDADLNLQSIMGLQTWNALRAMDVLANLPDVDASRLGVTGGSGGGTQTILLGALDPRVRVAFPNGMVSTSMQGGCYCENCNYLRIDSGNVELAALFAPKPQGMTAADDWTRDMMTDGFPELQRLYRMLGKPDDVMCRALLQFPHNYNYVTRATMYPWMARHLELPDSTPLVEEDFEPFSEAEMHVWNDDHPMPKVRGVPHEQHVLAWWSDQSSEAIADLIPDPDSTEASPENLRDYQRIVGGGWRTVFDRDYPAAEDIAVNVPSVAGATTSDERRIIHHPGWNNKVEVSVIEIDGGASTDVSKRSILVFADATKRPWDETIQIARRHVAEHLPDQAVTLLVPKLLHEQRIIDDERTYSGFTFTYNRTLAARQCEQVLLTLATAHRLSHRENSVNTETVLVANGQGIGGVCGAAMVAGPRLSQLIVYSNGFRFAKATSYRDPNFVPGSVKYLDLPGLLALRAPYATKVMEADLDSSIQLLRRAYLVAGAASELEISSGND